MFLGRIVFFRLDESPRYLVHAGRKQDALESLQMISRFNGSELALDLDDVEDHIRVPRSHLSDSAFLPESLSSSRLFNADSVISSSPTDIKVPSSVAHAGTPLSSTPPDGTESTPLTKDYSATGGSEAPLSAYAVVSGTTERRSFPYHSTPAAGRTSFHDVPPSPKEEEVPTEDFYAIPRARSRSRSSRLPARHPRRDTISSVRSSLYDAADRAYWALPRRIRRPVRAWLSRYAMVLEPEWRRTTACVGHVVGDNASIHDVQRVPAKTARNASPRDICEDLFAREIPLGRRDFYHRRVSGNCGAFQFSPLDRVWLLMMKTSKLGAWLIERPGLGRRLSLAGSTLLTAMLCVGFVLAQNPIAVTASTVGISLSSSVRGLFLLACGSILSGSTTGYVGCVIWVRHGLDCNRLTKAEILLCPYQAGRLKYLPRKVSLRRLRIFCLSCRAG